MDIKVKSTITVSINNTEFELSTQDAVQLHDELAKILNITKLPLDQDVMHKRYDKHWVSPRDPIPTIPNNPFVVTCDAK